MADRSSPSLAKLFEETKFGRFTLSNRVKYGACCVSNFNTTDGFITPRELARTKVIAGTGCGMITNQGAYPDPLGEGKAYYSQIALYDDKFLPGFETIAGYIHDNGAVAIQQILHAGRYGGIDLGYCVQPSEVPQTLPHFRPPREMTKEQIRECIAQHAAAAKRAIKAGFDGVELTSFMGYLLANFLSSFTNQRTDEYGGSIENRARFMRELISETKEAIGDAQPLIVRLNGAELMDQWGGNSEDECFETIRIAATSGMDMLSVTVGWQEAPESSIGRDVEPGHWNRLARRAKEMLPGMPVAFGVRLPDPVMANACIENGDFDFWEVCRPLLADPELVHKAREERLNEAKVCVGSLNCLSRMFRDLPYSCTINPALGHEVEPEYHVTPAVVKKRVMVIGAGPAGMEAAIAARGRGHDVTIFEKSSAIGGALRSYAANDIAHPEDLAKIVSYYEVMADKLGIEVRLNTEPTPKMMRGMLHEFDAIVIATGSLVDLAALPITGGALVLDAFEVAAGRIKVDGSVAILGGGKVGLTLAEKLRSGGRDVTIIDAHRRLGFDVAPTWKWRHTSWIKELGIGTVTGVSIDEISTGRVQVTDGDGNKQVIEAGTIIAAMPIRPAQALFQETQWMIDELHGAGDALVVGDLTQAIHSGYRLGCRI
ncbi:MAG: FAD-dependent oxidoreductase [Rhodospirillales bacterium]|nr:FAD-dependent oxidoreductase [Rhodospirillales bacterium]